MIPHGIRPAGTFLFTFVLLFVEASSMYTAHPVFSGIKLFWLFCHTVVLEHRRIRALRPFPTPLRLGPLPLPCAGRRRWLPPVDANIYSVFILINA